MRALLVVFMSVFTKQWKGESGMLQEELRSLKRRGRVAEEKVGNDNRNYGSSSSTLITGSSQRKVEVIKSSNE